MDASIFSDFDYVALGHIHGPQNIGSNRIRYCGTPLKYSFSEEHHHKSVTVVKLGAKGELELMLRPLNPKHDMRSIRGTFEELTNKSFYSGTATDDYLQIILTDEDDVPEAISYLRDIYPNILQLSYDNCRTRSAGEFLNEAAPEKSPLELFEDLYQHTNGRGLSEEQQKLILALLDGEVAL